MRHPDISLAAYLEGAATPRERRVVEAHLEGCERCRAEVGPARAARAALASLPELAPIEVDLSFMKSTAKKATARRSTAGAASGKRPTARAATAGPATGAKRTTTKRAGSKPAAPRAVPTEVPPTEALPGTGAGGATAASAPPAAPAGEPPRRATTPARVVPITPRIHRIDQADQAPAASEERTSPPRRARPEGWRLRFVQAALGAAAVLVAIVLFVGLNNTSPGPQNGVGGTQAITKAGSPEASGPAPAADSVRAAKYSPATFATLAERLAGEARAAQAGRNAASYPAVGPPPSGDLQASEQQAIACIERGTGLIAGTRVFHLERATFNGQAAWVGAFLTGTKSSEPTLLVLAIGVKSCQPLQVSRQPL